MTRSVLIVDGDEQYVPLLKDVFRRVDFEVYVAQDGEQALALATKHDPSLMLLSVELPAGPSAGYLICRDFKTHDDLNSIPILMTSRKAKEEDFAKHRKLKTRADDYLRKPFTDEDLFQRVENILGFQLTSADFEALEAKMHKFLEREDELVAEVADRDIKLRDMEHRLEAAEAAAAEAANELEQARAAADEARAEAEAAAQEPAIDEDALAELRERLEAAEAELKLANKRADRASEDAKAGAARVDELEEELADRDTALESATNSVERLEREKQELEKTAAGHEDELKGLQERIDAAESERDKLQSDLEAAQQNAKDSEAARKDFERDIKKLQRSLGKIRTAANKLVDAIPDIDDGDG